jgi:hypothetical protein
MSLIRLLVATLVAASLAACTTTVQFTSNTPGAEVTYLGKRIGVTPFTYDVQDQFGWFSVYEFKATRAGYKPKVVSFAERTPLDAQGVVSPIIHFDLSPEVPPAK